MLVVEGDQSFYLFAGSKREEHGETKRYASYAVQWAMMREARTRGARRHDLWGVAPANAGPDHPWHGVGLFKKGFGGHEVTWAGSWEVVDRPARVPPAIRRLPPPPSGSAGRAVTERRMGLGALADVLAPERVIGIPAGEVTALTTRSEEVTPGSVFFALPGQVHDGWTFIPDAAERGAVAVVAERESPGVDVPQLIVANARHAVADAADAWFGRPSEQLRVLGITGTDGKSTTAFLSLAVLLATGRRPGMVGTVDTRIGDVQTASTSRTTTPEALELQSLLADMVEAGNDSAIIEATSHGLAQSRTRNCRFRVGVVTTITSEHLEFHGTVEAYREAKALLVEEAPVAVLNADDDSFEFLTARAAGTVISYGIEADADLRATALDLGPHGSRFHVAGPRWEGSVSLQLPARFNVSNALAALALAEAEGLDPEQAAGGPCRRPRRPGPDGAHRRGPAVRGGGRLRPHRGLAGQGPPRAASARCRAADRGLRLGRRSGSDQASAHGPGGRRARRPGGGDRRGPADRGAGGRSTRRSRRAPGRPAPGIERRCGSSTTAGRRSPMPSASPKPGDVVLLAGKGHEPSIIYGDDRRWWDEREVARQELRAIGFGTDEPVTG